MQLIGSREFCACRLSTTSLRLIRSSHGFWRCQADRDHWLFGLRPADLGARATWRMRTMKSARLEVLLLLGLRAWVHPTGQIPWVASSTSG